MRALATLAAVAGLMASVTLGAQEIRDLSIVATLHRDGSATIVQDWDVTVVSGTEFYVPVSNLRNMTVSDLRVSEDGRLFVSEGSGWDTGRSIERKAGRCGIVEKGSSGVELCWGIGSYGAHSWTVTYELSGLVQSLRDYDAFNHQFVNPGMSSAPRHAKVVIDNDFGAEWTDAVVREWAFGTEGTVDLVDGKVVVETSRRMASDESVIVMVRFDKGMFSPAVSRDIPFEKMQSKAFRGSDYSDGDDGLWGVLVMAFLIFGLPLLYGIYAAIERLRGNKYRKSMFGVRKITGWWREAPLEGDIPAAAYVLKHGPRFGTTWGGSNVIGAFFLRWLMDGTVTVRQAKPGGKRVDIVFGMKPEDTQLSGVERSLYEMAYKASGDGVLEKNEFRDWSKDNAELVMGWPKKTENEGFGRLVSGGLLRSSSTATAEGQAELRKVFEFKNFLSDFTLSSERGATEVGLWKDYLVFAQLFGIADKVASQFKKLYPAEFEELSKGIGMDGTDLIWYVNYNNLLSRNVYDNAYRSVANKMTSSEIGGFGGGMSIGGGGGFSGGGFGGGSR